LVILPKTKKFKYLVLFYSFMVKVSREIKENPLKNVAYSSIIFTLSVSPDNSVGIAVKVNKTQSIVWRQMNVLRDKKLITKDGSKKNSYHLNIPQFIKEYMLFCLEKGVPRSKIKEKYTREEKILLLFMTIFKLCSEKSLNVTIENLFENISVLPLQSIDINKTFKEFALSFGELHFDKYFYSLIPEISKKVFNEDLDTTLDYTVVGNH